MVGCLISVSLLGCISQMIDHITYNTTNHSEIPVPFVHGVRSELPLSTTPSPASVRVRPCNASVSSPHIAVLFCFSSTTRSVLWMGKNGMRRAQTTTYAINTHLIRDFAFHYQIIRAIHAALCSGVASSSPCACVEVKEFICITYTTSVVYSTPRGGSATQMTCVCVYMCVNVFNTIKYSHNARVANLHDANGRGGFARRRKSNVSRTGTSFTCSAIRHSLRSIHLRVCVCVCVCVPSKRLPGTDREYIYANMHVLAVAHTVTHAQ